jgi:hypothetical protein
MQETVVSPLTAWDNFYVIVGSSAAALTGLMFVVIALIAEAGAQSSSREIAAFGTPTIVHFGAVLLMSTILSAPWRTLSNAGLALGVSGAAGVVYVINVIRRARRQMGYRPVMEDWVWHTVLPFVAYAMIAGAAVALRRRPEPALFGVGAATVLLLFVGIHNAWDTVTYVAVERWRRPSEQTD